jgi:hypothetical protein
MNEHLSKYALPGLRWAVGLVVLAESCAFAFGAAAARAFAHTGLPPWIRPALGGAEAIAALLFLVPATTVAGGYALLVIFFLAATIHLLHGWYDVDGLIVYFAAVLACMANRDVKLAGDRA